MEGAAQAEVAGARGGREERRGFGGLERGVLGGGRGEGLAVARRGGGGSGAGGR